MLTTTVPPGPAARRARSISERWPAWSAPIVGTRTTREFQAAESRVMAATDRTTFIGMMVPSTDPPGVSTPHLAAGARRRNVPA